MIRHMMYLRPGNFYKDFVVEESRTSISNIGRPTISHDGTGERMLRGALAEASEEQKLEWKQLQHPITHTIVQDGKPKAKNDDRLLLGSRVFTIQGVVHPGSIGVCTIYYVEERLDEK